MFYVYTESESELSQSCPTLCDPMDSSLRGSSICGIFQARVLEWVAISFSRGSSPARDWTRFSRRQADAFTVWATTLHFTYFFICVWTLWLLSSFDCCEQSIHVQKDNKRNLSVTTNLFNHLFVHFLISSLCALKISLWNMAFCLALSRK